MLVMVGGARLTGVDHQLDDSVFARARQPGDRWIELPSHSKCRMRARSDAAIFFILTNILEKLGGRNCLWTKFLIVVHSRP